MATTAERIAALEEAIASGELRVTYDGKTVEYRSISELQAALAYWQNKEASETATPRHRQTVVTTGKGY
ncbi:MAG: hypothetical protein AB1405_18020 [Bdellovibrionota bacterium]